VIDYNAKSWLRVIVQVRGSVFPSLFPRIIIAAGLGGWAAWLHQTHHFKLPPIAHTLVGVALGLLLVFRTNTSYDRYWEGRRLLGALVNRCRDLARQAAVYLDGNDEASRADRAELARLIPLLYALIRQYLRNERDLAALGDLATPAEKAALEPIAVRPTLAVSWITARLAAAARDGRLTEQRLQVMDANLTSFVDNWGGAERIMKTPIPFAYAQHIKAFLVLFCFTAPFAMSEAMGWYTPAAAAILAFAMFGIDEIGVEIEDPFGYDANDLPLDRIGDVITRDVKAILAADPLPAARSASA
jgi:ion channel-forming bestrophin family protein